jgi:hypothetical protein
MAMQIVSRRQLGAWMPGRSEGRMVEKVGVLLRQGKKAKWTEVVLRMKDDGSGRWHEVTGADVDAMAGEMKGMVEWMWGSFRERVEECGFGQVDEMRVYWDTWVRRKAGTEAPAAAGLAEAGKTERTKRRGGVSVDVVVNVRSGGSAEWWWLEVKRMVQKGSEWADGGTTGTEKAKEERARKAARERAVKDAEKLAAVAREEDLETAWWNESGRKKVERPGRVGYVVMEGDRTKKETWRWFGKLMRVSEKKKVGGYGNWEWRRVAVADAKWEGRGHRELEGAVPRKRGRKPLDEEGRKKSRADAYRKYNEKR